MASATKTVIKYECNEDPLALTEADLKEENLYSMKTECNIQDKSSQAWQNSVLINEEIEIAKDRQLAGDEASIYFEPKMCITEIKYEYKEDPLALNEADIKNKNLFDMKIEGNIQDKDSQTCQNSALKEEEIEIVEDLELAGEEARIYIEPKMCITDIKYGYEEDPLALNETDIKNKNSFAMKIEDNIQDKSSQTWQNSAPKEEEIEIVEDWELAGEEQSIYIEPKICITDIREECHEDPLALNEADIEEKNCFAMKTDSNREDRSSQVLQNRALTGEGLQVKYIEKISMQ